MTNHGGQGERLELAGIAAAQHADLVEPKPGREVAAAQVVSGRQIGDNVGHHLPRQQPLEQVGGVHPHCDRKRPALGSGAQNRVQRLIEISGERVDGALGRSTPGLAHVCLGHQADSAQHSRDRGWLRGAHPAQPRGDDRSSGQRAAEMLACHLGERLVGSLQYALGADVLPAPGGQAAPGDQVLALQVVEDLGGRPAADQVGACHHHRR